MIMFCNFQASTSLLRCPMLPWLMRWVTILDLRWIQKNTTNYKYKCKCNGRCSSNFASTTLRRTSHVCPVEKTATTSCLRARLGDHLRLYHRRHDYHHLLLCHHHHLNGNELNSRRFSYFHFHFFGHFHFYPQRGQVEQQEVLPVFSFRNQPSSPSQGQRRQGLLQRTSTSKWCGGDHYHDDLVNVWW